MEENDHDNCEMSQREEKLGFKPQKEIVYNRLLPYWEKLDEESNILLSDIKEYLSKAVLNREIRPGIALWTSRLIRYIKVYGLKFSKEDHVAFVHLAYELCSLPELDPPKLSKYSTLLSMLLRKKKLLDRNDLVLPWRPLYKLYSDIVISAKDERKMYRFYKPNQSQVEISGVQALLMKFFGSEFDLSPDIQTELNLEQNLKVLICVSKHYFPIEATQEILDELMPLLCPFDVSSVEDVIDALITFLPTTLPIENRHQGFDLWFNDLMTLWSKCNNESVLGQEVLHIVSNLASQTIGYIDWEPYIPTIFTRILRNFSLPVTFKQTCLHKKHQYESSSIAIWIVSVLGPNSSAQKHLDNLISTVETYLHPANSGTWAQHLRSVVSKLPQYFVHRVSKERYRKLTWENKTPEEHKLTEEDITKFVECLKPLALQTMFSNISTTDQSSMMQNLALLRPNIIVPSVVEKMYSTLDSLTEPHKLTACLVNLVAVARPLVEGFTNGYPEGPTHVIPLLFATLPGIDPNDFKKSLLTSHLISVFAMLIPIVDSSKASEFHALTELEHAVCEATASFEDFVLQFLDKIFLLIESSTFEMTRMEQRDTDTMRSRLESMSEATISSTTSIILVQSSVDIYKAALRKLFSFITTHTFETKVAGQFIASVCKAFSRVNGEETLKLLLPYLCQSIQSSFAEHENFDKEEKIDNECLYHMLLLSAILDTNGVYILPYIKDLIPILDRTLQMNCKEASNLATYTLQTILMSLSTILITDFKSSVNIDKPINEYLAIREWGYRPDRILDANLQWHVPNDEEIANAKVIILRYLPDALVAIERYSKNELELTREELLKKITLVTSILSGAGLLFPIWDEEQMKLLDSVLPYREFTMYVGVKHEITMPNGDNIRRTMAQTMNMLQLKLLNSAEDDTKSLIALTVIWELLLFRKARYGEVDILHRNFKIMKRVLEDKLCGKKKHSRHMIADKVCIQHEFRMESENFKYTPTHSLILNNLLQLSTSYYSVVRKCAQARLCNVLNFVAYSYLDLLPKLEEYLKIDSNEHHEKFKGVLFVLLGAKQKSLMCKYDWKVPALLWPALLRSKPSEKPSVIFLLEALRQAIKKFFPTLILTIDFPESLMENARKLLKLTDVQAGGDGSLSLHDEEKSIEISKKHNEENLKIYYKLLDDIMTIVQHPNLHWRYVNIGLSLLRYLAHKSADYPKKCVQYFLQQLISDSLEQRKVAMRIMIIVLQQQKREHKKIVVDPYEISNTKSSGDCAFGFRADNEWLQYNSNKIPKSEKEWNELYLLKKATMGFLRWPKNLEIYAPYSEQPKLERTRQELNEIEKEIYDFFNNKSNVDKLMKFLTIEEKKGQDKFTRYHFLFFMGLFRNFGATFLDHFIPHLERLVVENDESSQRAASELLAGLIRGSKHWPFEMIKRLEFQLVPIIKNALNSMVVETVLDWGVCFATAAERQDPRRQYWLMEALMEDPLRNSASYIDCGRMFALQGSLNQNVWRCSELINRLFEYIKPFLMHQFQNVRERLGSVLVNITDTDVQFFGEKRLNTPQISSIMDYIMPKLSILHEQENEIVGKIDLMEIDNGTVPPDSVNVPVEQMNKIDLTDDRRSVAIRLLKTALRWVTSAINTSQYMAHKSFYQLLPLACRLENSEQDAELAKYCKNFIAALAQSFHPLAILEDALRTIENITMSGIWWARCNALDFLQVMIFHNMSMLVCETYHVRKVLNVVLGLLEDQRLEVREKAGQVLGGLLHCNFILEQEQLLDNFKTKSKTKLRKHGDRAGCGISNISGFSSYWEDVSIRTRHTAVLGMCAFISAYPYNVPHFMPDVFAQLGVHLNDPEPIPSTIRKTLGDFKRTHHDNWETHKQKFTEEQLAVLGELVAPPSYYV